MDSYGYVAAKATVYLMENPDVARCISWASTVYQYAALAIQEVDFPFGREIDVLPDPAREALDNLRELLEIVGGPTGPVSEREAAVDIGGPAVEVQIAEISKLQDEQEKQRAGQTAQMAEQKQEAAADIGGPAVEVQIAEISKLQDEQEKQRAGQTAQMAEQKQEAAADIGGPAVEVQIAEISKLQDEHAKQLADQTVLMAEHRKLMVAKYPNSPEGVEHPNVKKFDEVAKAEQDRLGAGQKAELQKLQERQMSNPSDPSRNR